MDILNGEKNYDRYKTLMVTFILTFVSSQSVIHCGAGSACNQFSFGSDPDKISCGIRLKATWGTLEGALAFSRT